MSDQLLDLAELRSHCRVDDPIEDAILVAVSEVAQSHVEQTTGQILTRRSVFFRAAGFPEGAWTLTEYPVLAVERIDYVDETGAAQTVPVTDCVLARDGGYSVLRPRQGVAWPATAPDSEVSVELLAGYPEGECPAPLRHACLLLAAHFYENREAVAPSAGASGLSEVPFAVNALLAPFRRHLLT